MGKDACTGFEDGSETGGGTKGIGILVTPTNITWAGRGHRKRWQVYGGRGGWNQGYAWRTTDIRRRLKGRKVRLKNYNGVTHTYDISNLRDASNQYTITLEDIGEFIGANYIMGGRIKWEIYTMDSMILTRPKAPIAGEDSTIYPIKT